MNQFQKQEAIAALEWLEEHRHRINIEPSSHHGFWEIEHGMNTYYGSTLVEAVQNARGDE